MAAFAGAPVGFIGLGIMGKPMVPQSGQAGYDVIVYNRSRDDTDALLSDSARNSRRRQTRVRSPSGAKRSSPCSPIPPT